MVGKMVAVKGASCVAKGASCAVHLTDRLDEGSFHGHDQRCRRHKHRQEQLHTSKLKGKQSGRELRADGKSGSQI